jgi:hypothetical protein
MAVARSPLISRLQFGYWYQYVVSMLESTGFVFAAGLYDA